MPDILFIGFISLIIVATMIYGYYHRPQCPKCKTKMVEQLPHGEREVYKCEACDKEWIEL